MLIPSSQSDDCIFDSILARQQIIHLVWVLGDGPIIICISIFICGMVSSCFGGINLAFIFLPYSVTLDNLPKLFLGYFLLIYFQFLLSWENYFSILLFVSSALSLDIF